MDEKEIAVILEGHDHEIGSLKHRMHAVEQETKTINNIAMSIQRIAINVENILVEMGRHNDRIESLEKKPAETSRMVKQGIINTIIGGALGAFITKILTMM